MGFYLIGFLFQIYFQSAMLNIISAYDPKYGALFFTFQPVSNLVMNGLKEIIFFIAVPNIVDVSLTSLISNPQFAIFFGMFYILMAIFLVQFTKLTSSKFFRSTFLVQDKSQ